MAHQVQNLVATAVSSSEIQLYWDDVADLTDEAYDIERDGSVIVEDYSGTHTMGSPYQDTGLNSDQEYTYRVRAVGGTEFAPDDISGLIAWYDFSDVTTLWQDTARTTQVTTNGQSIKGVTDLSGVGNHLSEATNAPTYATNTQNSLSAASGNSAQYLSTGNILQAQPISILVAGKFTTSAGGDTGILGNNANDAMFYKRNATPDQFSIGSVATHLDFADDELTNWHTFVLVLNGASSAAYYDSSTAVTGTASSNGWDTEAVRLFTASTGNKTAGKFGEAAIYDGAMSAAQANALGVYAAAKWGVTWT